MAHQLQKDSLQELLTVLSSGGADSLESQQVLAHLKAAVENGPTLVFIAKKRDADTAAEKLFGLLSKCDIAFSESPD